MKTIVKKPIFWLCILSLVFLISRLINITALPIFTDEAIYIRWAQIGGRDASWRFISLTDGKQPLFVWAMMVALRIFRDPLFAGRFASVLSGLFGMIGMYFLGTEVFKNKRIGLIASFLFFLSPFALFYDRLALYDSSVSALSVWNLYLAILLVRHIRLDIALILGLLLGVGMLNKSSAFLSLYLLPVTLLLFDWKAKKRTRELLRWIALALLSAVLSQMVYSVLRLSPYFYIIAQKDTIFVYPLKQWVIHPFEFFIGNIRGMFDWLTGYLTRPLFLGAVFGFFIFWKQIRAKLLLVLWWFLPFAALALFGRVLYPRFILFMSMPLLVLSAWSIDSIMRYVKHRWIGLVLAGLICFESASMSYSIVTDIKTARIPTSERGQYIDDWPSGWGIPQIVTFLKKESIQGNVSVYTEGTFGLLPYAFEIFLQDRTTVDIHGMWPVPKEMPDDMKQSAVDHATYFVMYQSQIPPPDWHLQLLEVYQKGTNTHSTMRLYKVNP